MKYIISAALLAALSLTTFANAQSNKPIIGVGTFESSFGDYDSRNIQTAVETAL